GLAGAGVRLVPARMVIASAPEEHVGLGVGTQLSLAVARVLLELTGRPAPAAPELAALCGRGLRSGIGLHRLRRRRPLRRGRLGAGGARRRGGPPPLPDPLVPPAGGAVWFTLPGRDGGRRGPEGPRASPQLPPVPEEVTDRLCRLVLLGILPAVVERDLPGF